MFRVFDQKEKVWVKDGVYLSPYDDLTMYKKKPFVSKLALMADQRYVWQRDIGLTDKKDKLIFEGDICRANIISGKDTTFEIIGLVSYEPAHASFYLFDFDNSKYYTLGDYRCKQMEIIGNICENRYLLPNI